MPISDNTQRAVTIVKLLQQHTKGMEEPAAQAIVRVHGRDPFLILISCLLSLRTRDVVSLPVSLNLFKQARTPQELTDIPYPELVKLIYKTSYHNQKAKSLHHVSKELIERFDGKVPRTYDELRSIKGIGPKTANLVLGVAFGIPALCVDTHVHRVSNRLGIIKTKTPKQTEAALKQLLPQEYWIEYNRLIVMWGQNICVAVSPFCSRCVLLPLCEQRGVKRMR